MAESRFLRFTRAEWARLRADTPLTLSEDDLTHLRWRNDRVSLDEVVDIYLPLALRKTAFQDPASYFHPYANLSDEVAETVASGIWREINEPNLFENILPTRDRAHLILEKGPDHSVQHAQLRKA
jgi:pantothenate kinase